MRRQRRMECALICSLFLFPGCLGVDEGPEPDDEDLGHMESAAYFRFNSENRWRDPTAIPVCWANGYPKTSMEKDPFADEREVVEKAVRREFGNRREFWLNFVGWQRCTASLDMVPINVTDETPKSGVGEDQALNQGIKLNFEFRSKRLPFCPISIHRNKNEMRRCIEGMAVHEFLHVAGFEHEQDRPDTPPNVEYGRDPGVGLGWQMVGEWDRDSESNYNNPNIDGVLSPLDVLGLQILYVASRTDGTKKKDGIQKLVRLYKDANRKGPPSRFGVGRYSSQRKQFSIGNDAVSSVSVPDTYALVLCDSMSTTGGRGDKCFRYSRNDNQLAVLNNRASYAEVLRAVHLKDNGGYSRNLSDRDAGAYLVGDREFGNLRKTRLAKRDCSSDGLKKTCFFKERYVSAASITVPPTCVAEVCSGTKCVSVGSAQGSASPDILGSFTKLTVRSVVEMYGEAYFGGTQRSLNPMEMRKFSSAVKSVRVPPGLSVDVCVVPAFGESDVPEGGEETRLEYFPFTRCQSITGDFGGTPYLGDRFVGRHMLLWARSERR